MAPWQEIYTRPAGAAGNVIGELRAIEDPFASSSVSMILDVVENAQAAQRALADAFDAPAVQEVRVYNIADGEAMSGLILAGRRANGEATFLTLLLA
jgi:hypothetical protein